MVWQDIYVYTCWWRWHIDVRHFHVPKGELFSNVLVTDTVISWPKCTPKKWGNVLEHCLHNLAVQCVLAAWWLGHQTRNWKRWVWIRLVPLSKALYHTCFICGQRCKWWFRRLKLTSSVISDVKPMTYFLFLCDGQYWATHQQSSSKEQFL